MNVKDAWGCIIIKNFVSPSKPIAGAGKPEPPSRASDILFLAYQHLCSQVATCTMENLRYVLHDSIRNEGTRKAILSAFDITSFEQLGGFPGKWAKTDCDVGLGLLGTPNGAGMGFMVAEHMSTFKASRFYPRAVYCWNYVSPMMMFEFGKSGAYDAVPPPSPPIGSEPDSCGK